MNRDTIVDYRITFFVKEQRISPRVSNQLTRLAKQFMCLVYLDNITQKRSADLSHSLGLLQVGLTKGDC